MSSTLAVTATELSMAVALGSTHFFAALVLAGSHGLRRVIRVRLLLSIVPTVGSAAWYVMSDGPSAVAQACSVASLAAFASVPLIGVAVVAAWGLPRGRSAAVVGSWLSLPWAVLGGMIALAITGVVFAGSVIAAIVLALIVVNGAWNVLSTVGRFLAPTVRRPSRWHVNPGSGLPARVRGGPDVGGNQWGSDKWHSDQ